MVEKLIGILAWFTGRRPWVRYAAWLCDKAGDKVGAAEMREYYSRLINQKQNLRSSLLLKQIIRPAPDIDYTVYWQRRIYPLFKGRMPKK